MYGNNVRILWVVIITLVGLLGAVTGGVLLHAAGTNLPASLGIGGAVFTGLVSVGLGIMGVLRE